MIPRFYERHCSRYLRVTHKKTPATSAHLLVKVDGEGVVIGRVLVTGGVLVTVDPLLIIGVLNGAPLVWRGLLVAPEHIKFIEAVSRSAFNTESSQSVFTESNACTEGLFEL